MQNKVQLIAYADRLTGGGGLRHLRQLLHGPLQGVFGAVHVLPFYTPIDGADAGFDPTDHLEVDPRLGQWDDVRALAADVDVMADVIVNHISSRSRQFADFSRLGRASAYAGMFLTLDSVFPHGAREADLAAIYRPRPGLPFTLTTLANGERRALWTTFTAEQIDIDVHDAQAAGYLDEVLQTLARCGVRIVRLDAVGYAVKRAGSSCFLLPETFEFIDQLTARARALNMEVVVEVHSYFRDQIAIAQRVDRVYDFALPPLVLHAFAFQTATRLRRWIDVRPANALNVLDTHDGIGIIDVGADPQDRLNRPGLVAPQELARLVDIIHERTHGASRRASGSASSNVDLYQVNSTFYDAMGRDDLRYLLARAIQLFLPGIPQVYYVGLLAGTNDIELLTRTGVGRDINRHHYTLAEVVENVQRPVVAALLELIRLRNSHPAFDGAFESSACADHELDLQWRHGDFFAELQIDFKHLQYRLRWSDPSGPRQLRFLESGRATAV